MSCPGASSSKDEDQSSDSSEDREAKEASRCRRALPHSVFTHALTSTRLKSRSINNRMESFENPKYGNKMRLYSKTKWFLTISHQGYVYGVRDELTTYGIFEITSAGDFGHIHIRAIQSNLYLAFNEKGNLYGEANKNHYGTVWIEDILAAYSTFLSKHYAHLGWYLGLKKSGYPKNGKATALGQNATKFLPMRIND